MRFTSDQLNQRVLKVIQNARPTIDNRITKEVLCVRVYGYYNDGVDRKVRDAISELRGKGEPIIADSGHAGYYYDPEQVGVIIADMKSRIIEMSNTIRRLEDGYREYQREQVRLQQPVREAVQMGLL